MNIKRKINQSLKILSFSLLGLLLLKKTPVLAQNNNNSNQNSSLESTILQEINKARTNPIAYADLLESDPKISSNSSEKENVNQALNFLRNLSPLPAIKTSPELKKVASEIVVKNETNTSNTNGYKLINIPISNNLKAEQIVLNLLNNKNQQEELFSKSADTTGIACNSSSKKCIMAYPQSSQVAVTDSRVNSSANNNPKNSSSNPTNTNPVSVGVSNPQETNKPSSSAPPVNNTNNPDTVAVGTQQYNILERGTLEDGDLLIPSDGSLYDAFEWKGKKGDSIVVTLESKDFDAYLAVQDSKGKIIAENDDLSEGNSNSSLSLVLPSDGTYRFIINSYDPKGRGDYTISVERK